MMIKLEETNGEQAHLSYEIGSRPKDDHKKE